MISQFTQETEADITLATLGIKEKNVYSVGRLDKDSEGLLLLTNNTRFKTKIINPDNNIVKTYWAQVEGEISELAMTQLMNGINIKVDGKVYKTKKAEIIKIPSPPHLPDRTPPIRYRESIPTTWVEIKICEGKNRQVRKMCAAVGFPVLRLIRVGIGGFKLHFPIDFSIKEICDKAIQSAFLNI